MFMSVLFSIVSNVYGEILNVTHATVSSYVKWTAFYPNVTTLRSGLCCRKSVCLSSVCLSVVCL